MLWLSGITYSYLKFNFVKKQVFFTCCLKYVINYHFLPKQLLLGGNEVVIIDRGTRSLKENFRSNIMRLS